VGGDGNFDESPSSPIPQIDRYDGWSVVARIPRHGVRKKKVDGRQVHAAAASRLNDPVCTPLSLHLPVDFFYESSKCPAH